MRIIAAFLFFAFFAGLPVGKSQEAPLKRALFKTPPGRYYPMPFWHMNGAMTKEGIVQQLQDAKYKAGFSGVAVLPVSKTEPAFLSNDYFDHYQHLLTEAEKLNMNVILYDDINFPSGMAGGEMEKQFPEDVRKALNKTEVTRRGPSLWKMRVPEGKLMAAVAMNEETSERINLRPFIDSANVFMWDLPKGNWRLMFFTSNIAPFFKKYLPVDYLDTAAVQKFMTLTYDQYARRFQKHFRKTIQLSFFDDVGFLRMERAWTHGFNDKFKQLHGFDPEPYYPALWYNIGPETEAARVAFFDTRAELLSEGYMKVVHNWTKKHGLKNTGHPPDNTGVQPVAMSGDIFKFYRHTDIPLADFIIYYERGRDGFKLVSSASDYYDRPVTAVEMYGALKEEIVDSLMLYRAVMETQARGINFIIPHGMWYNPEAVSIPPLVSPYSKKLAPALPAYSDYVARSCYLLQGGRRVADIGLLYPIASLEGGYYFDSPEKADGRLVFPETDYQKIGKLLTNEIRRDFTFLHPQYLATDKYVVQKENLHLANAENFQDYKLLIIPGGKVISVAALQKIKAFYDNGGKVIATTLLPTKSAERGKDSMVQALVAAMFGGDDGAEGRRAIFVPGPSAETLAAAIERLTPNPDVAFVAPPRITSQLGMFNYLHKVVNGKQVYFFANPSDNPIDTDVLLRGRWKLAAWNPHNGAVSDRLAVSYLKKGGEMYTKCHLTVSPVSATFWVSE